MSKRRAGLAIALFILSGLVSLYWVEASSAPTSQAPDPYGGGLPLISSKNLPPDFETSAWVYRVMAEHLLSNTAGSEVAAESPREAIGARNEVIGWLLAESGGKGIWWDPQSKKIGDPNINRFVLLPLIDTVYRLHPLAGDDSDWRAWRAPLQAAVDFQVQAYEGKVDWDWGGLAAGQYPNQDVYYALILAIASRLFDEPRYQALADQMTDKLAANLLPNGAFYYIGKENDSPIYHALIQVVLARYYDITNDQAAYSLIRNSSRYWLLSMSDEGQAEAWSDMWVKQIWIPIPAAALTVSAKASGDPEIKWREQALLAEQKPNGSLFDVYAKGWWDQSLPAKEPSPHYLVVDRDIRGIRGKDRNWYYGLTEGTGLRNTFVGGMISSSTSRPALRAAFRGAQIAVELPSDARARPASLSQAVDRTVSTLSGKGFGLLGTRYTLQPPTTQRVPMPETPDSPWQVTQVWAAGSEGLLGTITLLSLADNKAVLVSGRLPLGPGPVEQIDPSSWKCGPLKVRLYNKFGSPTIKAIASAFPSPVSTWPGIEFSTPIDGMKQGDRFQYSVWIGPDDQAEPQELVPREDGTGWTVHWKGKASLKVSFDPNTLRIEMN